MLSMLRKLLAATMLSIPPGHHWINCVMYHHKHC